MNSVCFPQLASKHADVHIEGGTDAHIEGGGDAHIKGGADAHIEGEADVHNGGARPGDQMYSLSQGA